MADASERSKLIAGLRNLAEKHAANNPEFAKLRILGKGVVDEIRRRLNQGETSVTLGAYISRNDEFHLIDPATKNETAQSEIVATLRRLSTAGQILGGACGTTAQRSPAPNAPNVPFIDVHVELVDGLALRSAVPADLSVIEEGAPGMSERSIPVYAKKVEPRIFIQKRPV
jgi:hypothetical protein